TSVWWSHRLASAFHASDQACSIFLVEILPLLSKYRLGVFDSVKLSPLINLIGLHSWFGRKRTASLLNSFDDASESRQRQLHPKYLPSSLDVFGNGMFNKDEVKPKGVRCGAVKILWRRFKKREAAGETAGDLLAVLIHEYLTSEICNTCKTRMMSKAIVYLSVQLAIHFDKETLVQQKS
ncbi:hypothetical protein CU098_009813, partial [Rhizopus stolonifer]